MRSPQQTTCPLESSIDGGLRKRVCKACDRCRLKKSKCDGASPCGRCRTDNAICVFGERKKSHDKVYPKGYVELLEQQQAQLVGGLQELYRRTVTGHGWPGLPLQDSGNGHPLTHDILERLGVLETEGSGESDSFEEDLELMQQRLLEGGSGFARRQDPSDSESEHTPTPNPFFEPCASTGALFHETFPMRQMPPTPPLHSPYHASNRPTSLMQPLDHSVSHLQLAPGNGHASMNPAILQQQSWCSSPAAYMENMEYTTQVESPPVCHGMSAADLHRPWLAMNAISPRAAMADWTEEDFNAFLNPSIMV